MQSFKDVWLEKKNEFIISAMVRGLVGSLFGLPVGILAYVLKADSPGLAILAGVSSAMGILGCMMIPKVDSLLKATTRNKYKAAAASRVRSWIKRLPEAVDDLPWMNCCDTIEASMRGMGGTEGTNWYRKTKILRALIKRAEPANRHDVATEYLDSMAFELSASME